MNEKLDAILDKAVDLQIFLSSPILIEEYYEASAEYYGANKFQRGQFDSILKQLKYLAPKYPALGKRLMEACNGEFLRFELNLERSVSRGLNEEKWQQYLASWKHRLEEELPAYKNNGELLVWAKPILEQMKSETDAFLNELASRKLDARQVAIARNDYYRTLCERTDLNQIAASMLLRALNLEKNTTLLNSGDGTLILGLLRDWRNNLANMAPLELRVVAAPMLSLLRDRLPTLPELLEREDIFPKKQQQNKIEKFRETKTLKAGVYRFEPATRRFHSVWRGIPTVDCYSRNDLPGCPLIGRWILAAALGGQTLHIKTNTAYHGSIQFYPITFENKQALCIEFWSPLLSLRVIEKSEKSKSIALYLIVIKRLDEALRKKHILPCMADNFVFDNTGLLKIFKLNPISNMVHEYGSSGQQLKDELLADIAKTEKKNVSNLVRYFSAEEYFFASHTVPGTRFFWPIVAT